MTKADLVAAMAKAAGGSKVSAERALNAFLEDVFDALKKGQQGHHRRLRHLHGEPPRRSQRPQPSHGQDHRDPRLPRAPLQAQPLAERRRPVGTAGPAAVRVAIGRSP